MGRLIDKLLGKTQDKELIAFQERIPLAKYEAYKIHIVRVGVIKPLRYDSPKKIILAKHNEHDNTWLDIETGKYYENCFYVHHAKKNTFYAIDDSPFMLRVGLDARLNFNDKLTASQFRTIFDQYNKKYKLYYTI